MLGQEPGVPPGPPIMVGVLALCMDKTFFFGPNSPLQTRNRGAGMAKTAHYTSSCLVFWLTST